MGVEAVVQEFFSNGGPLKTPKKNEVWGLSSGIGSVAMTTQKHTN